MIQPDILCFFIHAYAMDKMYHGAHSIGLKWLYKEGDAAENFGAYNNFKYNLSPVFFELK